MFGFKNLGNNDTRSGFGVGLVEVASKNKNIVALCADLTGSLKMNDFKNIYGQDLAIEILKSAIQKEHISPAYLFSGPEGVGRKKTAKIFIKSILDKNQEKKSYILRKKFEWQ